MRTKQAGAGCYQLFGQMQTRFSVLPFAFPELLQAPEVAPSAVKPDMARSAPIVARVPAPAGRSSSPARRLSPGHRRPATSARGHREAGTAPQPRELVFSAPLDPTQTLDLRLAYSARQSRGYREALCCGWERWPTASGSDSSLYPRSSPCSACHAPASQHPTGTSRRPASARCSRGYGAHHGENCSMQTAVNVCRKSSQHRPPAEPQHARRRSSRNFLGQVHEGKRF